MLGARSLFVSPHRVSSCHSPNPIYRVIHREMSIVPAASLSGGCSCSCISSGSPRFIFRNLIVGVFYEQQIKPGGQASLTQASQSGLIPSCPGIWMRRRFDLGGRMNPCLFFTHCLCKSAHRCLSRRMSLSFSSLLPLLFLIQGTIF